MSFCPRCGSKNEPGSRFCGGCGLKLEDAAPAPPPFLPPAPIATPEPRSSRGPWILLAVLVLLILIVGGVGGWLWYQWSAVGRLASGPADSGGQYDQSVPAPAPLPPSAAARQEPPVAPPRPEPMVAAPRVVEPARRPAPSAAPSSVPVPAEPAPAQPAAVEQPVVTPPAPVEQPAPAPAPPPPPAAKPVYSGPPSGTLVWSGQLKKNGTITIQGDHASVGSLHGELPGVPIMIEIQPSDVGIAEAPSPANGWKRVVLRSRVNRRSVVTIQWKVLR
jgi:hypothetical protein